MRWVQRLRDNPRKSRATRCDRVAPFSIESLSFRFSINLFESGSVLPWPPRLNRFVKLYFLVQLTIAARCYPGRIFECAAKLLASAFVQRQPGFTRAALNSAAKRAPRSNSLEASSVLSLPFPLRESRSFSSQFNPLNASSVLPVPSSENRLAKFYFPIQLRLRQRSFIFAAIPELTREVFLPDQSAAHTKRSEKCWQELSRENSVEICACLWKKVFIHFFSKGWMVAFTRN
jgi:hypothetical protein